MKQRYCRGSSHQRTGEDNIDEMNTHCRFAYLNSKREGAAPSIDQEEPPAIAGRRHLVLADNDGKGMASDKRFVRAQNQQLSPLAGRIDLSSLSQVFSSVFDCVRLQAYCKSYVGRRNRSI